MSDLQRVAELIGKVQSAKKAWDDAVRVHALAEASVDAAYDARHAARVELDHARKALSEEVGL